MKRNNAILPIALIVLQDILYGIGDPVAKAAFAVTPVFSILTVRYWLGFALLMLFFGKTVIKDLRGKNCRSLVLPSLCIGGAYMINNTALKLTAATSVAFIRSLSTVMTPMLAFLVLGKKYNVKKIPLLVFELLGLYLLCGHGGLSGFGIGEAMTLLGALLMAGSLVFAVPALKTFSPFTVTVAQSGTLAVIATILAFTLDGGVHLAGAESYVWFVIIYLAVMCTFTAYLMQNIALRMAPASTIAFVQCACPVMTALFSFFILKEKLTLIGYIGAAIIVICVAAEALSNRAKE